MQSTAAMELCTYIIYTARCVYTAHARTSASLPRARISLVSRRLLASEASFDPPVALHVAAAFRWSRNCAKAADGELQLICILAFSRHNFSTEGFFETPHILIQEKPKRNP